MLTSVFNIILYADRATYFCDLINSIAEAKMDIAFSHKLICGTKVNFIYNINKQDTSRRYSSYTGTIHECICIEANQSRKPDLHILSLIVY